MRVGLIGPPQSGKSTLFTAIVQASGSGVNMDRPDQPHLAVVKVPDERLHWLAELESSEKIIPAELEFLDIPGMDLSDESGRNHARTFWPAMRQSDMLVHVVRGFESDTVPAYRNRIDPDGDIGELLTEMLFADLDQVTARIAKLEHAIRKPTVHRDQQKKELELMTKLAQGLEDEKPVSEIITSPEHQKLIRSFALLSPKPAMAVLNCSEDIAGDPGPETLGSLRCLQLSAEIEKDVSELDEADRGEFLADLGIAAPARDRMIRECYTGCTLISFLTVGPEESRAWTIPAGTDAVTAAGTIHSDIARGFIRAETVAYDDLKAAGDMKAAKAAGRVRLEGKTYIIQDGDVMHFRFNV